MPTKDTIRKPARNKLLVIMGGRARPKEMAAIAPAAAAANLFPVVILADSLTTADVFRAVLNHGDRAVAIVLVGAPVISIRDLIRIAPLAAIGVHHELRLTAQPDTRYLVGTDLAELIESVTHVEIADDADVMAEVTPPPVTAVATAAA